MERPTQEQFRRAAKRKYHSDGSVEIDENAAISYSDGTPPAETNDGAYVAAWVYVSNEEARK